MNFEFLVSPQSFTKNTAVQDTSARNDISSSVNSSADSFYTRTNQAAQDKRDSFQAFLRNAQEQKKQGEQPSSVQKNDTQNQNKTDNQNKTQNPQETASSSSKAEQFYTRLSSTTAQKDPLSALDGKTNLDDLSKQIAELLSSLEEAKQDIAADHGKDAQSKTQIQTDKPTSKADLAKQKIMTLLTSISKDAKLPEDAQPQDLLASVINKLRNIIKNEKDLLVAVNKTPEQMAKLQQIVQDLLKKQISEKDRKALEALASQWVNLSAPEKQIAPQSKAASSTIAPSDATEGDKKADPLQNAAPSTPQTGKDLAQERYDARFDGSSNASSDGNRSADTKAGKLSSSDNGNKSGGGAKSNDHASPAPAAGQRFLQSVMASLGEPPIVTSEGTLVYTTKDGVPVSTVTTSTSQAALTNVVTQATHASQPHPATQAVVATLNKAFKTGDQTNIKIQLDPPELGRVEVKMSIDKDNKTKVVLTSEKPETHMMLQRDSHILERVLQDSGLNTDGGLSFELSQDFNNPGGHGEQGGHNGNASASGSDNLNGEVIQTRMDWSIDPETGILHYNALA